MNIIALLSIFFPILLGLYILIGPGLSKRKTLLTVTGGGLVCSILGPATKKQPNFGCFFYVYMLCC